MTAVQTACAIAGYAVRRVRRALVATTNGQHRWCERCSLWARDICAEAAREVSRD
jgi:hypothetical protein